MLTIEQRLAQAVQHQQAGRLAEAEALYRGILQEAPRHPHALHLLGVLAYQVGRYPEAIQLIQQALMIHGPHPVFHSNLGSVYLAAGLLVEAVAHSREAVRLQPDLADGHNNLGVALRRQGQLEEAEAAFRRAIELNPNHVDARASLGAILHKQGKLQEALDVLHETVSRAPRHAQAQNDLAGLLLALDHPEEAVKHFQAAIQLRPRFPEAYSNLGLALRDLHRFDEAMECFRNALRMNPNYAQAHNNLGFALEAQGKIEAALAEFHEALRLEPQNTMALASLSNLVLAGHYRLSDSEARTLREVSARRDLPVDDRQRMEFALARQLEQEGTYAEAFEHYQRGNELRKELNRRRGIVFDPVVLHRLVDRIIATFTPELFNRVSSGLDSELPVFVLGMLRSGTTLTEQILASHPRVHGAGELDDWDRLVVALSERLGAKEEYPECARSMTADQARALGEERLERLRKLGGDALRVVDKLPRNFMHLGLIAILLPKARVIHCRRDPVDTCLSCFLQNFANPHPWSLDLRDLGLYYREYERLMEHWKRVLPLPILELHYEELTANQEAESRRLIAFCGLEWDERCLRFHETERVVRTASSLQVRQPMYRSSVGKWKRYEAQLGPLLEALRGEGA